MRVYVFASFTPFIFSFAHLCWGAWAGGTGGCVRRNMHRESCALFITGLVFELVTRSIVS